MKIDLKKDRKELYHPAAKDFVTVEIPDTTYLAIDGHGDPNVSPEYAAAVQALYSCAYAVRACFIARTGDDFVVGPLEGLWSSEDPAVFVSGRKADWDWTMLIPMPDPVSGGDIAAGIEAAAKKKPALPISELTVLPLSEGLCLQIMHLGPYDDEGPILARLHDEVMPAKGLTWNGRHHEIYLTDPRKSAPEKMKTVLRQPVRASDGSP